MVKVQYYSITVISIFHLCRYKTGMGVICTDPPPPQDSPPPKEWRKMNPPACRPRCAEEGTQPHPSMSQFPKSCHLSTPLHKLCSSSELKTPVQRERVCVFHSSTPPKYLIDRGKGRDMNSLLEGS